MPFSNHTSTSGHLILSHNTVDLFSYINGAKASRDTSPSLTTRGSSQSTERTCCNWRFENPVNWYIVPGWAHKSRSSQAKAVSWCYIITIDFDESPSTADRPAEKQKSVRTTFIFDKTH